MLLQIVISMYYVENDTSKGNPATHSSEIDTRRVLALKQYTTTGSARLSSHPNQSKIYDSAIDVYDHGDFGKVPRRHDVQIIPAGPSTFRLWPSASFYFTWTTLAKPSSLVAPVVRDIPTDEIPLRSAIPPA